MQRVRRFYFHRPGRLILAPKKGLRARSVRLLPGARIDWHSTQDREELLLVIQGEVDLSVGRAMGKTQNRHLKQGQGIFLPKTTRHCVMNHSRRASQHVYVTGRA